MGTSIKWFTRFARTKQNKRSNLHCALTRSWLLFFRYRGNTNKIIIVLKSYSFEVFWIIFLVGQREFSSFRCKNSCFMDYGPPTVLSPSWNGFSAVNIYFIISCVDYTIKYYCDRNIRGTIYLLVVNLWLKKKKK